MATQKDFIIKNGLQAGNDSVINGDLDVTGSITNATWDADTIATNKGGTNLTSFTTNGAMYATSTSVLTTGTLPVTSGGTGVTLSTGTTKVVLSDSPTLTGTPVAPTAVAGTNTTQIATTAFVTDAIKNGTLTLAVSGTGLSGSASFTANQSGNSTFTVTSNATSANTASAIVARDGSGNFSAGTITATLSGNASTATKLTNVYTDYTGGGAMTNVVGMLGWKNYGNSHVIFDASNGTAPNGAAIDRTNSGVAWAGSYPTLMGWNGSQTYGVRVDTARYADSCNVANYANSAGSAGSAGNADTLDGNHSSAFAAASHGYHPQYDGTYLIAYGAILSQLSGGGDVYAVSGSGRLAFSVSSKRYKTDIANYILPKDKFLQLQPVQFKYKNEMFLHGEEGEAEKLRFGLIAEQVDEIGLSEFVRYNDKGQPDSINYSELTIMLISIIQDQERRISALEAK